MNESLRASWLLVAFGGLAFSCFSWGTLYHFARDGSGPPGAWILSLLSVENFVLFLFRLGRGLISPAWPLAAVLLAISVAIWTWTLRKTRRAPPSLAFALDAPQRLYTDGPYRWVRHPFYAAYMTCWVATALGTSGWVGWIATATIGSAYWIAARQEERKFERSPLAREYTEYRSRTGMFAPKLFR